MTSWPLRTLRAFGSLKVRITIGTVAALIAGLGLITLMLVNRAQQDTLRAERQRELADAARTATLLATRAVALQRALLVVAFQLNEATVRDDTALARFIEGQPVLRGMFTDVFVATPDGDLRLLANENGVNTPELNLGDRSYFKRTLSEGRPIISPPIPSRLSGEPVVVFTQPVRGPAGIHAVIGGGLRLSRRDMLEGLIETQEAEGDARVVVTDSSGLVLAHPDAALLARPLSDDPRLAQAFAAWVAAGSPVEPLGIGLPQPGELVSAAGVPGPDWMVWRARPEDQLLAPLRDARRDVMRWALGLTLLLSAAMLALLWWLLRPLTLLERRAQHLFDGTMPPRDGWPVAGGEIGSLSRVLRKVGMERAQLEVANNEVLVRLNSVMSAAPVGIAFLRAYRFELVSPEFCRLFGLREDELLGQPASTVIASVDDYAAFVAQELESFRASRSYAGEWRMRRRDGAVFWAGLRSKPVDVEDPAQGAIWTVNNIDDLRTAREQLEWAAAHDPLTGLANRTSFDLRARELIDALPQSMPCAMMFIDLDHFKPVNDTAGHVMGDVMLRAVAAAVTSQVRGGDMVARLGGDEFALLLENCSLDVATQLGHDVLDAIRGIALPWEERVLRVGASLGIAGLLPRMESVEAWVEEADAACYAAKGAGRNTVRVAPAITTTAPKDI
ncbi:MAG: diguanylate cyclase [Pseudomonadota bacterium]